MRKHWKTLLILAAIVLLSGYAGGLIGYQVAREKARRRSNPEAWNLTAMRTLDRRLKLTAPQHEKIQAILDSRVGELKATRIETVAKTNRVLDEFVAQIAKELSPEQIAELAKLRAERPAPSLEVLNVEPRNKP